MGNLVLQTSTYAESTELIPSLAWFGTDYAGITLTDSKAGNNGTLLPNSGGVWSGGTLGVAGIPGSGGDTAASYNGTSGIAVVTGLDSWPNGKSAMTLEAWCNAAADPATERNIVGWWYNQYCNMRLLTNGYVQAAIRIGTTNYSCNTLASLTGLGWKHLVMSYDGSVARFYVDGVQQRDPFGVAGTLVSTARFAIGGYSSTINQFGGYLPGTIQYPAIYTAALSADLIYRRYLQGANTFVRQYLGLVA